MAFYEAGEGRPLVFLHGIGGGASAWLWSKVAPPFVSRHRVVVPDWVGWGSSEHPSRPLEFEDYVAPRSGRWGGARTSGSPPSTRTCRSS
jgi:pimeloyl-ACP methyl ester carboxylesterase